MVKKIILVFKTHFDIGFTDLSSNVIDKYANSMLKEVISTCNATQHMGDLKYVWTMPSWPLKVITRQCGEGLKKELERLIDRGQIVWHALPFTSHTDFCSAEEYIEGLRFGRELSKRYHKPYPISAKMTDVPGHGVMLPQILAGAGVKFLHLGCNQFATPPKLPFLFHWQAATGERVLTMYSKGGYGTTLTPPQDWKYPVWMALMQTQDNCGPQSVEVIQNLVMSIRSEYPEAEIVCGSMDDFYKELLNYDLSKLPVVTEDLADSWIHGVGAYPGEVAQVREAREKSKRLQALRMKQVLEQEERQEEYTELLDEYYEDIGLFGEHTWGADVKTWLGPNRVYPKQEFIEAKQEDNYRFMEKSWQEQRERARDSVETLRELKIKIENGRSGRHSLFNPNSSAYTGWVSLRDMEQDLRECSVSIGQKELPVTRIDGEWSCFVTELMPLITVPLEITHKSSCREVLQTKKEDELIEVENHRYRLTFSERTGDITELYDKELHQILLQQQNDKPVFSYRYDRYGIEDVTAYLRDFAYRYSTWGIQDYGREAYPECEHKTYYPDFESYLIDGDSLVLYYKNQESVDKYGDAEKVAIEITLPPAGDELFVNIRLMNKSETPYIESGSFQLPCLDGMKHYRINKSNVVLNPETDIAENANHTLYCLENFISASGETNGICVIPRDTPLAALGGTGIYQYQKKYKVPRESVLCFNLFNNMWGTNFPQWIGGDFSFRYIIYGYSAEKESENLERAVMLMEGVELTSCTLAGDDITLPKHMQLINAREDKDGLVIRLRELTGERKSRKLRAAGCSITPLDLNNSETAPQANEQLEFEVRPYGIHSFLLKKR